MKLENLQTFFQDYLKNKDKTVPPPIEMIADAQPNREARLDIYHHAYRARLLEVLRADFPKLLLLLGDEQFDTIAGQYIEQQPSHHFSVRYFGQYFSDFLKRTSGMHPALSELACFEWLLSNCIDAPDAPVITKEDFLDLSEEDQPYIGLQLHPSVHFQSFMWQPVKLWNALQDESVVEISEPTQQPYEVLFWRKGIQIHFRTLSALEYEALCLFSQGASLAEVCEALSEQVSAEQVPHSLGKWLRGWIQEEILSSLQVMATDD